MRKLVRKLNVHGTLEPDIVSLLSNLDVSLYHDKHHLRHPLGIYNTSSSRVYIAFANALERLKSAPKLLAQLDDAKWQWGASVSSETTPISPNEWRQFQHKIKDKLLHELLQSYKDLLDAMGSFLDDMCLILKCFYPPGNNEVFAYKWLDRTDRRTYKGFSNQVTEYRSHLAPILNKLKHNNSRLRFVRCNYHELLAPGYYVEGAWSDGSVGPDSDVHRPVGGMATAFSFYRDIRFHLVWFYFSCHALKTTLERRFELRSAAMPGGTNPLLVEALAGLRDIPDFLFPDEYQKPFPEVMVSADLDSLEITYPGQSRMPPFRDYTITVITAGDGVTKSFKVPYL